MDSSHIFVMPRAMAQLKDKIENVLNETRILVLGIQILIGFDFRSFFEPGFAKMAPGRPTNTTGFAGAHAGGLGVLMIPASYHRFVLHGRNTARLHRLATATVTTGLLPFALAMGLSFFLGARWVLEQHGRRHPGRLGAGSDAALLVRIGARGATTKARQPSHLRHRRSPKRN